MQRLSELGAERFLEQQLRPAPKPPLPPNSVANRRDDDLPEAHGPIGHRIRQRRMDIVAIASNDDRKRHSELSTGAQSPSREAATRSLFPHIFANQLHGK